MLIKLLQFALRFVFDLFALTLLLRFCMQWRRIPFGNPLGRAVMKATNWIVLPSRRLIPGLFGLDLASFTLAWGEQIVLCWLLGVSVGHHVMSLIGFGMLAYMAIFRIASLFLWVLTMAAIVLWLNPQMGRAMLMQRLVDPFYAPLRGRLPPLGGFDLTPLLFLFLVQVVALFLLDWLEAFLYPLLFGQPLPLF